MATTERTTADSADTSRIETARETARDAASSAKEAAGTVLGVANEAMSHLPEAAATTRDTLAEASRTIRTSSDESLSAGTLVSFGFALGLLVGGANRLLVLLALVPAVAMGLTLLDRQGGTPVRTTTSR
jgi:hypothetical protein